MPFKGPRCPVETCHGRNLEVVAVRKTPDGRSKIRCRNCGTVFQSRAKVRYLPRRGRET